MFICTNSVQVGLFTTDLNKLQDPTRIITNISLPLNPLLSQEYCTTLCRTIISEPLTQSANTLLHILWKRCLGIPRAIQVLHETLQQFVDALKADKITAEKRKAIIEKFTENAKKFFTQGVSFESNQFGLEQKAWHKELVELSLCMPKTQNGVIG